MGNCLSKSAGNFQKSEDTPVSEAKPGFHAAGGQSTNGTASKQTTHKVGNHESAVSNGVVPPGGEPPVTKQPSSIQTTGISAGGEGDEVGQTLTDKMSVQVNIPAVEKKKDNTENKLMALELGIQAMELIESAVAVTELALGNSNPVGELLKKVTGVLVMLKKMVENKQAWKDLLATIDDHLRVFKEQIRRMEIENLVPDPESPLLSPINKYASALKDLMEEVIRESGFQPENAPNATAWEKIKRITAGFILADLEKERIQGYVHQLSDALNHFKLSLEIFTSFTIHNVKHGVDKMTSELLVVSENVKDMRETMIRSLEPKDSIANRRITAFGEQHGQCLRGTRVDVLEDIRTWADSADANSPHIYCIGDVAGTGKSTIAKTLAKEWYEKARLAAMFFFSQEGSSLGTASDFCLSVADQIEEFDDNPQLTAYWESISRSRKNLPSRDIQEQWSKLVFQPLTRLEQDGHNRILVIDALDECTVVTRGPLLECLLTVCSSRSLPHIRVLVTTRMEEDLRSLLYRKLYGTIVRFRSLLHSAVTRSDIALYVTNRLDEKEILISAPEERHQLITRCGGLFIFAHLACKLLEDAHNEKEPLIDILHRFTSLDALYHQALTRADKEPRYTRKVLRDLLGVILVARLPLPIVTIATLLSIPIKSVSALIESLGSILSSSGVDKPVYILHTTFIEFLLRQSWITTSGQKVTNEYAVNREQSNRIMAQRCLSVLSSDLKFNPGNLSATFDLVASREAFRKTPLAVQYAAVAWVFHIVQELHVPALRDATRQFFREKLLNWIEFGGVSGNLSHYMFSLRRLHSGMQQIRTLSTEMIDMEDLHWCSNTLEFLRINQMIIQTLPLQVYSSALAFTPLDSLIYSTYEPCFRKSLPRVILGRPTSNGNNVVFAKHPWRISRVAYSSDGHLIISAVAGGGEAMTGCVIAVWNVHTGANLLNFKLREARAGCHGIAFLPGNKVIISVWEDNRLYHLQRMTGSLLRPPIKLDLNGEITCVAWAPDWTRFVCGTSGGRIHRFSLRTGRGIGQPKAAHEKAITSVAFSHDGKTLASTSRDMTFKIWNVTSDDLTGPVILWNHNHPIRHGAFHPTTASLFGFVDGQSLFIYNTTTKKVDFDYGNLAAESLVFSQNGKQIAIQEVYDNKSVTLLKSVDGAEEEKMPITKLETSHTDWIQCMAISPDGENLVTGSWDFTVQVHQLASKDDCQVTPGHQEMIHLLAFTSNGEKMASLDVNGGLCIWDIESGELVREAFQTGTDHRDTMAVSSSAAIVACWHRTYEIKFWNTKAREQVGATLLLDYHDPGRFHIGAITFSPDDLTLAFTAEDTVSQVNGAQLTLLNIGNVHESAGGTVTVTDIDFNPFQKRLAYHPSGQYICDGESAWNLTLGTPVPVTGPDLSILIPETLPPLIRFHDRTSSIQSISLGSSRLQAFYLPPLPDIRRHTTQDGLIALGAGDGKVMVLDFTHLFEPVEMSLLKRLSTIRLETSKASRESHIERVLAEYTGPRTITIPRTETPWEYGSTEESDFGESESDLTP